MDELLMEENKLRRLAGKYQVPLGTLEKDYALTNLLSVIARFPKLDSMVFKGGTALKKIYFENFRFSEDLDFTCSNDVSNEFTNFLEAEMKSLDIKFTEITEKESKQDGFKFKVKYIQFNGKTNTSVKVDLSLRGDVLQASTKKPVLHFYDTFSNTFEITTMSLEEIMAEKIRAIIYTKHPRHLYDVWYLKEQNITLNSDMIRTKIKTVYGENFDINKFSDSLKEKEKDWINDLRPLLPTELPSFDNVSQEVLAFVTEAMK